MGNAPVAAPGRIGAVSDLERLVRFSDAPDRGVVLHWRWRREPRGDLRAGGRALLCADTFPGEDASFHILTPAPEEAGRYVLELGLTRGGTTFEGLGSRPLRLPATVRAPGLP